jgi:hypothetical protein
MECEGVKKHTIMILLGIVLVIVGIVLAVGMMLWMIKDPADNAVETLVFTSAGTQQVQLDKGDYQMWVLDDLFGWYGTVTITDSEGTLIWDGSHDGTTESINSKTRLGDFKIPSKGTYNVTTDDTGTMYITEPISISVGGIFGSFCGGLVMSLVGGILFLVGLIMWLRDRKPAQPVPAPYPPPGQYPPQQQPPPGQYPPQQQPPPGQYPPQQQPPPGQYPPQQQSVPAPYPPPGQYPPQQQPPATPPATPPAKEPVKEPAEEPAEGTPPQ